MFTALKRNFNKFVHKSTYIRHEPVNKVSIIILILIDIFVLFNVFFGLQNVSEWPLNPSEAIPCFSPYETYQVNTKKGTFDFDTSTIENIIGIRNFNQIRYPDHSKRLGTVSGLCTDFIRLEKGINTNENVKLKTDIDKDRTKISQLNDQNRVFQSQYDSSLLEKIAGQSPGKSINNASSDEIKFKIDANKSKISETKQKIKEKQTQLIQSPPAAAYLKLLKDDSNYAKIKEAHKSASFWHPNQQLFLQTLFLLPLIILAYLWHSISIKKNRGLQALLSWHLLLIFCIPLLIKFFEFIQFGNIVSTAITWITNILGGLLFIASYGFILLIPLAGFGLIKFLQVFVFNPKVQAKNRLQKVHCMSCNSKLRLGDEFCPYCGFNQYIDCSNCNQKTYKLASFCKSCGHKLEQPS